MNSAITERRKALTAVALLWMGRLSKRWRESGPLHKKSVSAKRTKNIFPDRAKKG